ncbi:MAG: LmbE family protein, partial [Cyanobacteria bacterium J06636_27]
MLADFVWIFRKFRPDVVITRFNDTPGITHGHHTASAMLAKEAFKLSGDRKAFPEQLNYVNEWQPKKLFWNTSWWFYRNSGQKMDTASLTTINVGKYNPLLGESYTEIAAKSRSMHKSQGFGSSGSRGDQIEYLEQWEGNQTSQVFSDIDTSWERVEGSEEVAFYINKALKMYDETDPEQIIPPLMAARKALSQIKSKFWKEVKTKELDELIVSLSGLYVSLSSDAPNYSS